MYRVYIKDRGRIFWLRRWIGADGAQHPILSTNRDHAMTFNRFNDALPSLNRLKAANNDAHIEDGRR